jgi:hypothetical protein
MYHLHAQNISRSAGHSAVKASCYRATDKSEDRRLGETYDFTRKDRAVHSEIIVPQNAPSWAKDRSELWNRVEEAEDKSNRRKSATLAKEMNMALPNAIARERQIAMVREFVAENFTSKGLAAQVDFHRGHKADEFKNNHVHVMVATRSFDGEQFGKKVRSIKDKAALYQWRDSWERVVNKELEMAKVNERVTARSYRSQGINRIATRHIGRGPEREARIAENDKIREVNRQVQGLELLEARGRKEREALLVGRGDLGQRTEEVLKDAKKRADLGRRARDVIDRGREADGLGKESEDQKQGIGDRGGRPVPQVAGHQERLRQIREKLDRSSPEFAERQQREAEAAREAARRADLERTGKQGEQNPGRERERERSRDQGHGRGR